MTIWDYLAGTFYDIITIYFSERKVDKMKKTGVFFGTGFEEIEALTVVDILRRAGVEVSCISIDNTMEVTGSHNITVKMNNTIENTDFDELDMIVCPGGMPGTKNLEACNMLTEKIKEFHDNGKLIGAICAAPSIFGHMGLLKGKKACIYPGMEAELYDAEVVYDQVVQVGNIITSRGMGTAIPFALAITANLVSQEKADELSKGIVYK